MSMITPMSKLELFVLKDDLPCAVETLQDLGLLHIEQAHLSKIMEQRGIMRVGFSLEQEKEREYCQAAIKEINDLTQALGHLIGSCLEGPAKSRPDF